MTLTSIILIGKSVEEYLRILHEGLEVAGVDDAGHPLGEPAALDSDDPVLHLSLAVLAEGQDRTAAHAFDTCEPTAHRTVRKVMSPTAHRYAEGESGPTSVVPTGGGP